MKRAPGRSYSVSKNTEAGRSTEVWGAASAPLRLEAGARRGGKEMVRDIILGQVLQGLKC